MRRATKLFLSKACQQSLAGFTEEIVAYLRHGDEPCGFTRAILENDLRSALRSGDPVSLIVLPKLAQWLESRAPARAWGSPERVKNWLQCFRRTAQEEAALPF